MPARAAAHPTGPPTGPASRPEPRAPRLARNACASPLPPLVLVRRYPQEALLLEGAIHPLLAELHVALFKGMHPRSLPDAYTAKTWRGPARRRCPPRLLAAPSRPALGSGCAEG